MLWSEGPPLGVNHNGSYAGSARLGQIWCIDFGRPSEFNNVNKLFIEGLEMAISVLRAALLALTLTAPVAIPVLAQELTAQEQVVIDNLPAALRAQILALPAAERQRLVATVAALPPAAVANLVTLQPAQFIAVATLPPAQAAVIATLPPADRVTVASAVATVKSNVAAGNVAGIEAAIANLAQAMNVVPQSSRATLAVAVATDVARSVEGAPPAVRQAASQAVTGAAGIASNPAIVGAENVISDAILQQVTQIAEAVLDDIDIDEVIAAVEEAASPTG